MCVSGVRNKRRTPETVNSAIQTCIFGRQALEPFRHNSRLPLVAVLANKNSGTEKKTRCFWQWRRVCFGIVHRHVMATTGFGRRQVQNIGHGHSKKHHQNHHYFVQTFGNDNEGIVFETLNNQYRKQHQCTEAGKNQFDPIRLEPRTNQLGFHVLT
jgi:hypothetical protein